MKHIDTGAKTAAGTHSPLWCTPQLVAVMALHIPPPGATTIVLRQESTQSCYIIKPHNLTLCSICCAASEQLWDDIEVASGSRSESYENAHNNKINTKFCSLGYLLPDHLQNSGSLLHKAMRNTIFRYIWVRLDIEHNFSTLNQK